MVALQKVRRFRLNPVTTFQEEGSRGTGMGSAMTSWSPLEVCGQFSSYLVVIMSYKVTVSTVSVSKEPLVLREMEGEVSVTSTHDIFSGQVVYYLILYASTSRHLG